MARISDTQINREISIIMRSAKPGDIGITRSTTIFGRAIRFMTSRGQHRAWGNHNFPIWKDENSGALMTLQIQAPEAIPVLLSEYLHDLYSDGGRVIICRPDIFKSVEPSPNLMMSMIIYWKSKIGTKYDKKSIWQILKMYCRIRRNIPDNGKEKVYCTEGTFAPYMEDPVNWNPETLVGERYPVPIHSEHLIRKNRLLFVGGSVLAFNLIKQKY